MIDPYTMEVLNAERLKDLDREAAGIQYRRFVRHKRRRRYRAALARLRRVLIAIRGLIRPKAIQN